MNVPALRHAPSPYWVLLLAMLPMLLLRDFTPSNELRYLSIADDALARGDFFSFQLAGEPYTGKPPLYLWLVMLCRWLLGNHYLWALALWSVLPACVIASEMYHWTMREIHPTWRNAARWMLLTTGLFLGSSLVCRMDMLMALFILLALRTFYKMRDCSLRSARLGWLLGLYTFLALFTKGPVGLAVPIVSTFVFMVTTGRVRSWFRCWNWRAWSVIGGGCLLWFAGVYIEGGGEYLYDLAVQETVRRAATTYRHAQPAWFYAATVWHAMMPWALVVIGTIVVTAVRRRYHSELQHYFLVIVVSTFIMMSCFTSKLDVYLLPIYPFAIYLAAMSLHDYERSAWLRLGLAVPAAIFLLGEPAVLVLSGRDGMAWLDVPAVHVAASLLTMGGGVALWMLYGRRSALGGVAAIATALLLTLFAAGFAMPRLNDRIGYGALCREAVRVADDRHVKHFYTYRMRRAEGLDVYLGRRADAVTPDDVADGLPQGSLLLVPTSRLPEVGPPPAVHPIRTVGPYAIVLY